jgi:Gas vesicle synthesis protein GvpL/GvpF
VPGDEATVYVYGILPAAGQDAVAVTGVKDANVRTVRHGSLAALVSDLEGNSLAAAKEVRAHWQVLDEALGKATVLPVRFGTVMAGESAVRDQLLEPNAERLTGLLRDLEGRVQLSLKAEYDEDRLLREIVGASPQVAALRQRLQGLPDAAGYYDRIRLGELVSTEIEHRREADTALALERLEPLAVEARTEELTNAEAAFSLAFLVDRDRLDRFSAAVRALAEEIGERLRIRYVGPLPPYSFADVELTAGGAGWA